MHHIGFAKEAGLKQWVGKGLKRIGRALGHGGLERKGLTMEHGTSKLVTSPMVRRTQKPIPIRPAVAQRNQAAAPKMQLVIPHGTSRADARVMKGIDATKQEYRQANAFTKKGSLPGKAMKAVKAVSSNADYAKRIAKATGHTGLGARVNAANKGPHVIRHTFGLKR